MHLHWCFCHIIATQPKLLWVVVRSRLASALQTDMQEVASWLHRCALCLLATGLLHGIHVFAAIMQTTATLGHSGLFVAPSASTS